ncbi:hypothetical protein F5X68DRAFT_59418 [Plectosphaerella plurivora]|uniref:Uncharacterized protein n=1 Tax=Plectosphaerella plurivora TaxID=936078 RepID=A0A9P8VJA6_9PEZI|nr:hypothetical protein F5X68DRAFT_59418 [Plectosphaerella plurivora]
MGNGPSTLETCREAGFPISAENCTIEFDSAGNVVSFAGIGHGEFEADPDVAGQGIVAAYFALSIAVCAMGIILAGMRGLSLILSSSKDKPRLFLRSMEFSDMAHGLVDGLILSCADTQLLLILAVGASFYATSQCTMSLYHFYVAFHMVLVGLATSILAFVLVQSPYRSYLSSLARIVIMGLAIGYLIRAGNLLEDKERLAAVHAKLPKKGQQDSLIILPAICVLTDAVNPFFDLTNDQKEHLRHKGLVRDIHNQAQVLLVPYIMLTVATLFGMRYRLKLVRKTDAQGTLQVPLDPNEEKNRLASVRFYVSCLLKGALWVTCLVLIIWNWITIGVLRSWVDRSEWLNKEGGNPEKDVLGLGQLAPLISLGVVGFALLDGLWGGVKDWRIFGHLKDDEEETKPSRRSSIQLQPMGTYSQGP